MEMFEITAQGSVFLYIFQEKYPDFISLLADILGLIGMFIKSSFVWRVIPYAAQRKLIECQ